jgi:cyclohexyl-isocyanide hydratase
MNRRDLHKLGIATVLSAMSAGSHAATKASKSVDHDMSDMPASWMGNEQIAMLLYPSFTALDLVGPHHMFTSLLGVKVHLVAKTKAPVTSDSGLTIVPTATFEQCPKNLDILFVPGGSQGTLDAMQDKATLRFLADRGARAKLITSVCTGSLVLGAAGLLKGYKATSHWVARDLLTQFGATPIDARVVQDRNRITGAGVTAGLDFGLSIVGQLRDREYAETVQLMAEYAPEPPFSAGSVSTAPPRAKKAIEKMFVSFIKEVNAVSK